MELRDQHILITGANRGIGRGLARMCAEDHAHLHLVMRQEDSGLLEELRQAGAASVTAWAADLGSRHGVEDLIVRLKNQDIDILINNAGQLTGGLLEEQPLDEIYSMFQVNLLSLVQLTRGLLPKMLARKKGKIINNASVAAFMHFPGGTTYAASKAAVVAFTNCLNAELKDTGVSTLCLVTPSIKTRMFDQISEKYGKIFDVPLDGLPIAQFVKMVREAILLDLEVLEPKGTTGVGLMIAKYVPSVFRWGVLQKFHRNNK